MRSVTGILVGVSLALCGSVDAPAQYVSTAAAGSIESRWGPYSIIAEQEWWRFGQYHFVRYSWVKRGETMRIEHFNPDGRRTFTNVLTMNGGLTTVGRPVSLPSRIVSMSKLKTVTADNASTEVDPTRRFFTVRWTAASGFRHADRYDAVGAPPFARAATPASPTAPPASPSGHAFLLKPDGSKYNFGLGQEYKLTGGSVTQPSKGMFSQYYFTILLNGKPGDRFRLDWNSAESVSLDYDGGRGYDVDYPAGATIFDKKSSATITLEKVGEHRLRFSQIGMDYSNRPSGGLSGPSLSGGKPRPFQTTYFRVSRPK